LPPSNIQAEQALLGALLANNKAYERVSEFLAPDHFADPIHGRIYQAIARRAEAGQLADAVMLKEEFEHSGVLQDVGGTAYLAQLLTAMVGIINAGEYGRAIYDAWGRRQLIEFGENVVNAAFGDDPTKTTPEILAEADKNLGGLTDAYHRDGRGSVISAIDAVDLALTEGEMAAKGKGPSSVSTGIAGLDQLILRLRAGNLYVVGGRPGMGKTALARSIAVNVSREKVTQDGELLAGDPVAYFSMEEGHAEFGAAIIAQLAGVPIAATLNGEWTDAQFQKLDKARQQGKRCATTTLSGSAGL
jgi:replicative DNA helicase